MPRGIGYTEGIKKDVVAQVTERSYTVQEISERIGITSNYEASARRLLRQGCKHRLPGNE